MTHFGTPQRRREDFALLTGTATFLADLARPDMAVMRVCRSPYAHARIIDINTAEASAHPDCLGIITAADLPACIGLLPALDLFPESAPVHQALLAGDTVRYVGEPVAIVLATDAYAAEDIAELVRITYEPRPAAMDTMSQVKLYPELASNKVHETSQLVGEPDKIFAAAALVLEEEFAFHRIAAAPMETRGAIAEAEPGTGRMLLYSSTQIPQLLRNEAARILGLDTAKLRVIAPRIGGGFGCKEAIYPEEILVLHAALTCGRPVFWSEDRQEHFQAAVQARQETVKVRAVVDEQGIFLAMEASCDADIGAAYGLLSNTPGAAMANVRGPYRIPHFRSRSNSFVTNKAPLNVYRGAGFPQATLCMERMMDLAARRLGLDRADIRRRNLLQPDEFPVARGISYPACGPVVFDSGDYPACLDMTLEAIGYAGFPARQAAADEGILLGLGLAFVVEMTGNGPTEPARLRVAADGKLELLTGVIPIGQGTETTLAQILADKLGVQPDTIRILTGDTDDQPDAPGTFASRGATMGGNAACLAGDALVLAARHAMARLRGVAVEQITWENGALAQSGGPNEPVTLHDLAARTGPGALDVRASFADNGNAWSNGCHAALVEIDRATGVIRVLDYAVTHDCGRVANPLLVDGQIMGGVMQGLGATLFEALHFDTDGTPITQGFWEYILPTAATAPCFTLRHLQTPSPLNPLGMKGAGEAGCTGAAAAIVNAIADALAPFDIPIRGSGPFTPETCFTLLRNAVADTEIFSAYLARLGVQRPSVDLAGLSALMQAHMQNVPFENLDIVNRRPRPLSTRGALEKIAKDHRGGFCYEVNEAFRALLQHLGFTVRRIEGRVWQPAAQNFGAAFDHLALVVTLPAGDYLVDVGYGDSNRTPLRLPADSVEDVSGHYQLRGWQNDMLILISEKQPLYVMTLVAQKLAAFLPMCRHHQTSPDSVFAKGVICTRATPSGRITLSGNKLSLVDGNQRTEQAASSHAEVLAKYFGMTDEKQTSPPTDRDRSSANAPNP
jgi:carbon-monoxide dehydrogenase large subunit